MPGEGRIVVNKRPLDDYFPRETTRLLIYQPLKLTNLVGKFDVIANVRGGGLSGQAGAIRHGISRALAEMDPNYRAILKQAGLLTRDPRQVERKKYGRPKARKSFQYSKR